jgi:predicted nucleic acid-binding protein
MRICIDTNIYSAFKKGDVEISEILENADEVYIPSVVLGELYAGFQMGSKLKDNIKDLKEFIKQPGIHIIDLDESIAERYGAVIKLLRESGTPIPTNDIWIAAAALENGARMATFDTHFKFIPGLMMLEIL